MKNTVFYLATISFLGLLLSFTCKYRNRASKFDKTLAQSSYDIYILHLPVMLPLQYVFSALPFPQFIKFGVIFILTTCICWAISRFLLCGNLLRTAASTYAVFLLLMVFG